MIDTAGINCYFKVAVSEHRMEYDRVTGETLKECFISEK
jgi:hypothetical protein